LVLGSLDFDGEVTLGESVQFALPALSRRSIPDPRSAPDFTLNQFNMIIALDAQGLDVSQVHFYPYNAALLDALPSILRRRLSMPLSVHVLRHLTIGLGYLPSWASPRLRVRAKITGRDSLPDLHVSQEGGPQHAPPMLRQVLRRMWRAAPLLDLWPVTPKLIVSAAAKSYHFGGSFPHHLAGRGTATTTDRLGRLPRWKRIHLVDGSVFPTVPATTFTLTVMANAHRIAEESLALHDG
jgi:choline dehydrogenase-like flavoprotein